MEAQEVAQVVTQATNTSIWMNIGTFLMGVGVQVWMLTQIYALKGKIGEVTTTVTGEIGRLETKVVERLEHHGEEVVKLMEREKTESILAAGRLDVLDRVGSSITDVEFSSKLVAKGDQPIPSTRTIRTILDNHKEKTGNA